MLILHTIPVFNQLRASNWSSAGSISFLSELTTIPTLGLPAIGNKDSFHNPFRYERKTRKNQINKAKILFTETYFYELLTFQWLFLRFLALCFHHFYGCAAHDFLMSHPLSPMKIFLVFSQLTSECWWLKLKVDISNFGPKEHIKTTIDTHIFI